MKDLPFVAEFQSTEKLKHKQLYIVCGEGTTMFFHVLTQICVLVNREGGKEG